ncbi:GGDEF domain-containing protein [Kineosporia succinea]|uniref:Diguanylate cyclase (GGDEF)-like protein n=1 Tax=Kineosporia succinea TaxID=84632 RepID=A0ABT9NX79_9ACTN|nr:GGDEF domain-containing protein [Kineosporia succinea]MDP9825036.1 diguanylate cyclase (GGDEF)-like protein [Kineosporia succinea]
MSGEDTTSVGSRRRAELVDRIGTELLSVPSTDAARARLAGWTTMSDLVTATPGLRAVRLARTVAGFGFGPWLGSFPQTPASVTLPSSADADITAVHEMLDFAAGEPCAWTMITYPTVAPEVTLALGHPVELDPEVVLTARSILNQVMLAYRNSLVHDELDATTRTEALTQLANRTVFTAVIAELLEVPSPGDLTLLLLDLDDFTALNDRFGHAAGDDLLVRVAELLRKIVPPNDLVARMGPDEFAVLLPGITVDKASRIAERVVSAVTSLEVPGFVAGSCAAVIGIAEETDLTSVLAQADSALGAAKSRGRNQVETIAARPRQEGPSRQKIDD